MCRVPLGGLYDKGKSCSSERVKGIFLINPSKLRVSIRLVFIFCDVNSHDECTRNMSCGRWLGEENSHAYSKRVLDVSGNDVSLFIIVG